MKKKQLATMGVALGLTAAIGVGGTLALLSAKSEQVTNTFVAGKGLASGDLMLNEAKIKESTESTDGTGKWIVGSNYDRPESTNKEQDRVTKNEYTNLESGDVLYKDPTVHVKPGTADCYILVNISGLDELKSNGIEIEDTNNELDKKWKKVSSSGSSLDGIYYYAGENSQGSNCAEVSTNESDCQNFTLFEKLNVGDGIFNETGASKLEGTSIDIVAAAVQAKNVDPDVTSTEEDGIMQNLPEGFENAFSSSDVTE